MIRQRVAALVAASAAGPVERNQLIELQAGLSRAVAAWDGAGQLGAPLVQYARDQLNDPTLDVAAEFLAMRTAADGLRNWIDVNFPRGAGGAVLAYSIAPDGTRTALTFTTAPLDVFRTEAATLLAAIS